MTGTIDEAFIGRTYRTSIFLLVFGLLVALSTGKTWIAAGWVLGAGMSIATLKSFEWVVRRVFVPNPVNAKKELLKFAAVKLPIFLLIIAVVVKLSVYHLGIVAGFCMGVLLTQAVMFLKVAGTLLNKRLGR